MSRRDIGVYLEDVVTACDNILQFTRGRSSEDFKADEQLNLAVRMCLAIIGEAIKKAGDSDRERTRELSHIAEIVALRNRIIHAYRKIESDTIWGIIETHVPALRREAAAALKRL